MQPGYRRRILIEPHPGQVTSELEDDYHRMVVTLTHQDGVVTGVESEMKRSPWTLCPGAMAQLKETFTGITLADFTRRGDKTQNCTHLYDLALFAAAHAYETAPVAYDIEVTDEVDGVRQATLVRDGRVVLDWTLRRDLFLGPPEMEGMQLYQLNGWISTLDKPAAEATRILRWASIIAHGRALEIGDYSPASAFPRGTCYNFQPERALESRRRPGAHRDLSLPGEAPMADRAADFPQPGAS